MRRPAALVAVLTLLSLLPAAPARAATLTPVQVYGAWHCSDDACTWGAVRSVTEFDSMNHWLIDRGDGRPSVNVVILSFVHPLRLLHKTTDATTLDGIPRGMTAEIVNYFKSRGIRVMLSIGGITYVDPWNQALAENPAQFARNAADVAQRLGVGIEIDYEENSSPNLTALQTFIDTYRSILPYDASGANHAARLTIDVAAGDRWLIALNRKATADWLQNSTGSWVQTVAPNGAGTTPGVLGYMFWAAERPSTRGVTTQPPNTCEGGVGAGATAYGIPIPLSA